MATIISLSGPIKSGKDTLADYAISMGLASGKVSFAGPLKKICMKTFNLLPEQVYEQKYKEMLFLEPLVLNYGHLISINKCLEEYDIPLPEKLDYCCLYYTDNNNKPLVGTLLTSPRHILQFIGTEYIRNCIDSEWHIKAAFSKKEIPFNSINSTLYVTDARFPNEIEFIKKNFNAKTFYIHRDEAEEIMNKSAHPSELKLKEVRQLVDRIIYNNGTLEEFYGNV